MLRTRENIVRGWLKITNEYNFGGLTDKEKLELKRLELWREQSKLSTFTLEGKNDSNISRSSNTCNSSWNSYA